MDSPWCWRSLEANIRARLFFATAEAFDDTYIRVMFMGGGIYTSLSDGNWLDIDKARRDGTLGSEVSAH